MNLCVIGVGYVGLVTGAVFADLGNSGICVDNDASKIQTLQSEKIPIYEPGLEEMVERNVGDGRLNFSTDAGDSIKRSDVVFITVGTPCAEDKYADISAVKEVAEVIGRNLNGYKIIVNKSTVPVGTGDLISEIIKLNRANSDVSFDVISNPEFLREGTAISDTLYPDRIVIGAPSRNAAAPIMELYAPLERPILITDVYSAEMIKYASNAFLATKISFINAISVICEAAGADVTQVAKGVGLDKRIGSEFLNAGLGYGGSCFGKDLQCFTLTAEELGYDFELIKSVIKINEEQPKRFLNKVRDVLGTLEGKTIALLGIAFKPNTDDVRDAKSLEIIKMLIAEGAIVKAYDPAAMNNARQAFPQIDYCGNTYDAVDGADAIIFATEWNEFKFLDLIRVQESMRQPIIFDGRNLYDPEHMNRLGFEYYSVGRPSSLPK